MQYDLIYHNLTKYNILHCISTTMVSSNPPNMDSSPLKIDIFHMGWNHHPDHVQKIYHMYSWWKKLRQISVEICAKKATRNGQKQQFRQNLWWLAPAFPDMSKNMALTTQLATLQAIVEIATKLFAGFLFLLYHPPTPCRPFKDEDSPWKSTVSGAVSSHHFLDTSTQRDLKGWNGPRTLAPTRGEFFSSDVEMRIFGDAGGVGR